MKRMNMRQMKNNQFGADNIRLKRNISKLALGPTSLKKLCLVSVFLYF